MRSATKIKAFTILEVTVAMVIAAISIGVTFTAYSILSKSYRDYDLKNKSLAELMLFDKLFKNDLKNSKQVIRSQEGLECVPEGGRIRYFFSDSSVIRNQYNLRQDTFRIPVLHPAMLFENGPAESGSLIDKIRFETRRDGQFIPFLYTKTYSAADLMNYASSICPQQ